MEDIPNRRRPLAPLWRFRAQAGGDLTACRLRLRECELAFWARRSCNSARLRSSKGFGIQGTLGNESHRATCRRGSITAGMDRFPLRGHLGSSASPQRELGASAQEPSEVEGMLLGSDFDTLSAARKQKEPGTRRLCRVPACPEDQQARSIGASRPASAPGN